MITEVGARVDEVRAGVENRVEEVRAEVDRRVGGTAGGRECSISSASPGCGRRSSIRSAPAAPSCCRRPSRSRSRSPLDTERSTVEIGFPPSAAFNKRKAEAKENRDRLTEALKTIVGAPLNPTYVVLEEEPAPPEPEASAEPEAEVDHRELVDQFKEEFDAEELIDDPEPKEGES